MRWSACWRALASKCALPFIDPLPVTYRGEAVAERVTGRKIPLREGPRRPGDPPALVANAGSARRELGWKPRYRKLEVMLATAWRWLQSRTR